MQPHRRELEQFAIAIEQLSASHETAAPLSEEELTIIHLYLKGFLIRTRKKIPSSLSRFPTRRRRREVGGSVLSMPARWHG
jgi:hypothetical protein